MEPASHPVLRAVAGGREAVREILGDHDAGFYGECYDFAFALKRITGTGSYTVLRGGSTVYHVLLRVGDVLYDAAGSRNVVDYISSNPGMDVLDAINEEIECLVDHEIAEWMFNRLSRLNQ